jgi:hypothetical protein
MQISESTSECPKQRHPVSEQNTIIMGADNRDENIDQNRAVGAKGL